MEKVSLAHYYDMLELHDWHYAMADSDGPYRKGQVSYNRMQTIAAQSQGHLSLFNGFKQHHFTGRAWNNEQAPKPDKPKE